MVRPSPDLGPSVDLPGRNVKLKSLQAVTAIYLKDIINVPKMREKADRSCSLIARRGEEGVLLRLTHPVVRIRLSTWHSFHFSH